MGVMYTLCGSVVEHTLPGMLRQMGMEIVGIEIIPDEKELGRHYSTLEKLLAHAEIAKYVAWKRRGAKAASRCSSSRHSEEGGTRRGRRHGVAAGAISGTCEIDSHAASSV